MLLAIPILLDNPGFLRHKKSHGILGSRLRHKRGLALVSLISAKRKIKRYKSTIRRDGSNYNS